MPQDTPPQFGLQLKRYRSTHKLSQMDLALACATTPRHVSFVETGRSRPGRGLILRMAEAMGLTPRQTNGLLIAAGLSPAFSELPLEAQGLDSYRAAVKTILTRHNPFPACALDQMGQIVMHNDAFAAFSPQLIGKTSQQMLTEFFEDGPLRQIVENWDELAWVWADRLRSEFLHSGRAEIGDLLEQALVYLKDTPRPRPENTFDAMMTVKMRMNGQLIETFTTVMRFEAARDVNLSELRVELIFPKNAAASALFDSFSLPKSA